MIKINRLLLVSLTLFVIVVMVFSCKKVVDKIPGGGDNAKLDTANSTWADRIYDSVFLYAEQIYYWEDKLPNYTTFKPRQYKTSDTLKGLQNEVFQLTRYAKDASGRFYEQAIGYNQYGERVNDNSHAKFSYIVYTKDTRNGGAVANTIINNDFSRKLKMTLDGKENNFGLVLGFIPAKYTYGTADSIDATKVDSNSYVSFVRFITKESPAYHAGLRRGDYITKVNGLPANYDNIDAIGDALEGDHMDLTVYKPSTQVEKTYSINKVIYKFDPFFKDTVVTITSPNNKVTKKIGYAAYKSFTEFDSSSKEPLERVINRFATEGIQDLVIDLRYNGGGSVSTAQNFIDYIAPSSANGKIMMVNHYNTMMQNKQATILKNLPQRDANDKPIAGNTYFDYNYSLNANTKRINKQGSLNLPRVYFIVSSSSASASEMMINSLESHMDVTLIGASFTDDGTRTYGKPIGFFEVRLGPENNPFSMWISNFETKNSLGQGGYYDGMTTDYQAFDDIRYDLGDPRERSFRQAIRLILGDDKYTPPVTMSRNGGSLRAIRVSTEDSRIRGARGIGVGAVTNINDMVIDPRN